LRPYRIFKKQGENEDKVIAVKIDGIWLF